MRVRQQHRCALGDGVDCRPVLENLGHEHIQSHDRTLFERNFTNLVIAHFVEPFQEHRKQRLDDGCGSLVGENKTNNFVDIFRQRFIVAVNQTYSVKYVGEKSLFEYFVRNVIELRENAAHREIILGQTELVNVEMNGRINHRED